MVIKAILFSLVSTSLIGSIEPLSQKHWGEVVRMARVIAIAQPNLSPSKYFEYGYGVMVAHRRYRIDPLLLIAITYQESAFREDLPEGPAGEIGLVQIRKNWTNNSRFKKEFGTVTPGMLADPSLSFTYAAWLLKQMRLVDRPSKTLPYWCYYNAKRFENRVRYFLHVNRRLMSLRLREPSLVNPSWESLQKLGMRDLSGWRPPLEWRFYPK